VKAEGQTRLRPSDFYTRPLPAEEQKSHDRKVVAATISNDIARFRCTGNGWWMWRAIGTWCCMGRDLGIDMPPELCAYLQRAALAIADTDGTTLRALDALGLANQSGGAHATFRAEQQRQMFEKFEAFNCACSAGMTETEALSAVAPQFGMSPKALSLLVQKMRARIGERR
jgi:hypothetical protein